MVLVVVFLEGADSGALLYVVVKCCYSKLLQKVNARCCCKVLCKAVVAVLSRCRSQYNMLTKESIYLVFKINIFSV